MTNFIIPLLVLMISSINTSAEEKSEYKEWKTFQSEYGYEFKYPACWSLDIDDPDEKGKLEKIHNLVVTRKSCKGANETRGKEFVSFTTGYKNFFYDSKALSDDAKVYYERRSKNEMEKGKLPHQKPNTMGDTEFINYVEILPESILRWRREIFCGQRRISVLGPEIPAPNNQYIEKLKTGDIALPEPERTIYESIKCMEPKLKYDSN